jgi:invasion protein IalB
MLRPSLVADQASINWQDNMLARYSIIALSLFVASSGLAEAKTKPAAAQPAASNAPQLIKQFDAWGAYSYAQGNSKVCYVLAVPQPNSKLPATVDHGDVYFLVTQRPGQNISYEPQTMVGYILQASSKVNVTIDDKNFVFFTKDKSAWVENAAEEPALVAAMKSGRTMTIKATSKKGTPTSYGFSLKGISSALKQIETCN